MKLFTYYKIKYEVLLINWEFSCYYRAADKNDFMTNTSKLLDSLLAPENYDRQIRPGFGGEWRTF